MTRNGSFERAMAIMAHPDDLEFFAGGTVALWTAAGTELTLVLATRGEKGGDPGPTAAELAAVREREQRSASAVLGVARTVFLDEPDGEVAPSLELRLRLVAEIRRHRPEAVVLPDPTRYHLEGYLNHPDHRAVGEAGCAAVSPSACNPRYHPELLAEGLLPHLAKEVWLAAAPEPNAWVDITATFAVKLAAMRCHKSQFKDMEGLEAHLAAYSEGRDEAGRSVHREGFRRVRIG